MLTRKQVRNIQRYFAEQAKNENYPTYKNFNSPGTKYAACPQYYDGRITWYEPDGHGNPVKYYDVLPE